MPWVVDVTYAGSVLIAQEVVLPHTFAAQLGQTIFLGVIAFSACFGGRSERVAAAACLAQMIASSLLNHPHGVGLEYGLLAADAGALVVFAVLAFATDRRWTLWATAFQALAVLSHVTRMLDPSLDRWAYLTAGILWGYAVLVSMAVGTLQVVLRRERRGQKRWDMPV